MPTVPVPIFDQIYKNVYGIELSQQSDRLVNGYFDEMNFVRGVPGTTLFTDLIEAQNKPVSGLFWWHDQELVMSVCDGRLRKTTLLSGSANTTNLFSDELTANIPVSFCTDGTYVFAAADGRIIYSNGSGLSAYIASANAPTAVSHVAFLDGYILANEIGSNQFYWSNLGTSLTWSSLNVASAEFKADAITALHVFDRQIFLFGQESLEVWQNDGVNPFSRIPGAAYSTGCIAPHSVVENRGRVYWLDNRRHFVSYGDGVITPMPSSFDREISKYTTVSDCIGVRAEIGGRTFFTFQFPTQDKTLLFDVESGKWSELGEWSTTSMMFKRASIASYCHAEAWGKHLFGDKDYSNIFEQSLEAYDLNGSTLRMFHRTGHIDYGTLQLKRNRELRLLIKRGQAGTSRTPKLMIRWMDDHSGRWSKERTYDLGDQGLTRNPIRLMSTGMYRTRQYEISITDPIAIAMGRAEEDIEVLA